MAIVPQRRAMVPLRCVRCKAALIHAASRVERHGPCDCRCRDRARLVLVVADKGRASARIVKRDSAEELATDGPTLY